LATSRPKSFSKYLTLTIVTLVTGTVILISALFFIYFATRLESEFREKLLAEKGQVEIVLENRISSIYNGLQEISKDNTIRFTMMLDDASQLNKRIQQSGSPGNGVTYFIRMQDTGAIIPKKGGRLSENQIKSFFKALPQGELFDINEQISLLWCFSMPIVDRNRQMGTVFIIYDMVQDQMLIDEIRGGTIDDVGIATPTGLISLLSKKLLPIGFRTEDALGLKESIVHVLPDWAISSIRNSSSLFFVSSRKGLISEKKGLSVVMGLSCLMVLILSLTISILLSSQLSRPLGEMANKAIQISEGNKQVVFGTSNMKFMEFRLLHQAFDHMLFNLIKAEEKSRYNELLGNVEDAVYLVGQQGNIIMANDATSLRLGYSKENFSAIGLADLIPDKAVASFFIQFSLDDQNKDLTKKTVITSHRRKDGTLLPVEINSRAILYRGKPVLLHVARDLTQQLKAEKEKKKLEEQLFQAQKMQAIGTLAGGVAHDFNNLLMAIQGRISLIRLHSPLESLHEQYIDEIEGSVKSAANLTRQLLGFARGGKYQAKSTQMNELIEKSISMFQRTHKEIDTHTKFETELQTANVDQAQMDQVFLNLYLNAAHAMADKGTLYIETKNCALSEKECLPHEVPHGDYISITIADTGIGMDEETMGRVFEPFFTTKPLGEGTGLGLASAYGIIKNHKGFIQVKSEKDQGSIFQIYLPVSSETACQDVIKPIQLSLGNETVLLIDDQQEFLEVGKLMLKELGYQVILAENGEDALSLITQEKVAPDIVLLDMVMPTMNGQEVFEAMRKIDPEIKILLCSGYGLNTKAEELLDLGCNGFIEKPFDICQLSQKIREAIEVSDTDLSN
jgi:two-component system, cell cycle sensor histidine kinase and response regulator CckA